MDSDDEKVLIVTDEAEEQILMMDEVSERKLDAEQRKAFDKAKDDALRPWVDNKAWARAKISEAAEGEADGATHKQAPAQAYARAAVTGAVASTLPEPLETLENLETLKP